MVGELVVGDGDGSSNICASGDGGSDGGGCNDYIGCDSDRFGNSYCSFDSDCVGCDDGDMWGYTDDINGKMKGVNINVIVMVMFNSDK